MPLKQLEASLTESRYSSFYVLTKETDRDTKSRRAYFPIYMYGLHLKLDIDSMTDQSVTRNQNLALRLIFLEKIHYDYFLL